MHSNKQQLAACPWMTFLADPPSYVKTLVQLFIKTIIIIILNEALPDLGYVKNYADQKGLWIFNGLP